MRNVNITHSGTGDVITIESGGDVTINAESSRNREEGSVDLTEKAAKEQKTEQPQKPPKKTWGERVGVHLSNIKTLIWIVLAIAAVGLILGGLLKLEDLLKIF